jgi:hypothetical protein
LEHPSYYRVGNLRNDLNEIYERLLSLWGDFLEREIDPNEIASLKREGKSVREILQEMIHADENHAHHYETR